MMQLSQDILVYSRACEHLLSTEVTLNDDETSLVEYYLQAISQICLPSTEHAKSGGTTIMYKRELRPMIGIETMISFEPASSAWASFRRRCA